MAVVIDATVGGANANSYLTLADAQAIIDGFVEDADVTAWASATTDQKNRALFTGNATARPRAVPRRSCYRHAGIAVAAYWCTQA
jgi:hypothetical protein